MENAFRFINSHAYLSQYLKDQIHLFDIICLVYRVNQDIVQICDDEDIEIFPKYIVNERLEAG
jgi:hypothetical protein